MKPLIIEKLGTHSLILAAAGSGQCLISLRMQLDASEDGTWKVWFLVRRNAKPVLWTDVLTTAILRYNQELGA